MEILIEDIRKIIKIREEYSLYNLERTLYSRFKVSGFETYLAFLWVTNKTYSNKLDALDNEIDVLRNKYYDRDILEKTFSNTELEEILNIDFGFITTEINFENIDEELEINDEEDFWKYLSDLESLSETYFYSYLDKIKHSEKILRKHAENETFQFICNVHKESLENNIKKGLTFLETEIQREMIRVENNPKNNYDINTKYISLFEGDKNLLKLSYYVNDNFIPMDGRAKSTTKYNQLYFYLKDILENLNEKNYISFIQENFEKNYSPSRINGKNDNHQKTLKTLHKQFERTSQ